MTHLSYNIIVVHLQYTTILPYCNMFKINAPGLGMKGSAQIVEKKPLSSDLVGEPQAVVIAAALLNSRQVGHEQGRIADPLCS